MSACGVTTAADVAPGATVSAPARLNGGLPAEAAGVIGSLGVTFRPAGAVATLPEVTAQLCLHQYLWKKA